MTEVPGGPESAWLTYEREGQTVRVDLKSPKVVIGRSRSCDLVLRLRGISRVHCTAERTDHGWVICDNDSSNGTFVNRNRVHRARLSDGDEISFGPAGVVPVTLTFHATPPTQHSPASDDLPCEVGDSRAVALEVESPPAKPNVSVALGIDDLRRLADAPAAQKSVQSGGAKPAVMHSLDADAPPAGAEPHSCGEGARDHPPRESVVLLALFADVADALLTAESLDDLLNAVLDVIFKAVPARRGSIWLYDETARTVSVRALRNDADPPGRPVFISRSIVNEAYRAKKALLVLDAVQDERFQDAASVENINVRSALCAPLFQQDRFLGFIYVDSPNPTQTFSEKHLQLLIALAQFTVAGIKQRPPQERKAESEV